MLGEAEEGGHWTAFILPYMEQDNIYKALTFGSNDFARDTPTTPLITSTNVIDRNIAACGTMIKTYRCPSTTSPEILLDASCYSPPLMPCPCSRSFECDWPAPSATAASKVWSHWALV
jgi:hypothetical protein